MKKYRLVYRIAAMIFAMVVVLSSLDSRAYAAGVASDEMSITTSEDYELSEESIESTSDIDDESITAESESESIELLSEEFTATETETESETLTAEAIPDDELKTATLDMSDYFIQEGGFKVYDDHGRVNVSRLGYNENTVLSAIASNLRNWNFTTDISGYGVPTADATKLMNDLVYLYPDLFFITSDISYSYMGSTIYSITFNQKYAYSRDDVTKFNTALNNAYNEAIPDDSVDKETKALLLHDWIVQHTAYTYNYFDAYQVLVNGRGVCQGYTLAYACLLKKAGITCDYCISQNMNHVWNYVQMDGQWYHVDCTWDDPTADVMGRAYHNNFLRSDSGITDTSHHSWTKRRTCTSTKYDDYWWIDSVLSAMHYHNGSLYYLGSDGQLHRQNGQSDTKCVNCSSYYSWYDYNYILTFDGAYFYFLAGGYIYKINANTYEISKLHSDSSAVGLMTKNGKFYVSTGSGPSPNIYSLVIPTIANKSYKMAVTYNGTQLPTPDVSYFESTLKAPTFKWYTDSACNYPLLDANPKDAGIYYLKVYSSADAYTKVFKVTIDKAPLTVKALAKKVEYGTPINADNQSVTVSGLQGTDKLYSYTLTPSITEVGTGTLTPNTAIIANNGINVSNNYSITYTTASYTITKANLSNTNLKAAELYYYDGLTLEKSSFSNTSVVNPNSGKSVSGTWSWKVPNTRLTKVGPQTYAAVFTPSDTKNNNVLTRNVTFNINKGRVEVTQQPSIEGAVYNPTLKVGDLILRGAQIREKDGNNKPLSAKVVWSEPDTSITGAGEQSQIIYYVPDDSRYGTFVETIEFDVRKALITDADLTLSSHKVFKEEGAHPQEYLKMNGVLLQKGVDYDLTYDGGNAKPLDSADNPHSIEIEGIGNFEGNRSIEYFVEQIDVNDLTWNAIPKQYLMFDDGKLLATPIPTHQDCGVDIGTDDLLFTYMDNDHVGTATVVITGNGVCTGTKKLQFKIAESNIESMIKDGTIVAKLTLDGAVAEDAYNNLLECDYTGLYLRPEVTLNLKNGITLTEDVDYKLTYSNNRKTSTDVRYATITIQGLGTYSGRCKIKFRIKGESNGSASSSSASGNRLTATINRLTQDVKSLFEGEDVDTGYVPAKEQISDPNIINFVGRDGDTMSKTETKDDNVAVKSSDDIITLHNAVIPNPSLDGDVASDVVSTGVAIAVNAAANY